MSTYYNYVRRGSEAQVDWGKIGSEFSDEITRISADRKSKKDELEKLNLDLIRSASEVQLPEQDYVRNLVLNGTNEMKNLALMNKKLLERGVISPAQYRMSTENMKANVSSLDKAAKQFGPVYQKSMQRLNSGEMPWLEQQQKENLFKYGNLKDKTLYVAPDGNMYITDIDANGDPVADPSKMMSVGTMAQGLGYEMKKYNVQEELTKSVASIAPVVEILKKDGILSTESAMNQKDYESTRDKYVDSMMADTNNLVSIMGDFIGGYNRVDDKSKAGGKNIFVDSNGNASVTDDQKKEVKDILTKLFDSMVKQDATATPIFAPASPRRPKDEDEDEEDFGFVDLFNEPVNYEGEEMSAADAILSVGSDIDDVDDLNLVLRRIPGGIKAQAVDGPGFDNKLILSAPGLTPITVQEDDDTALLDAIDNLRLQIYNATAAPSGGSGNKGNKGVLDE
jgi:hypothetical protein